MGRARDRRLLFQSEDYGQVTYGFMETEQARRVPGPHKKCPAQRLGISGILGIKTGSRKNPLISGSISGHIRS